MQKKNFSMLDKIKIHWPLNCILHHLYVLQTFCFRELDYLTNKHERTHTIPSQMILSTSGDQWKTCQITNMHIHTR